MLEPKMCLFQKKKHYIFARFWNISFRKSWTVSELQVLGSIWFDADPDPGSTREKINPDPGHEHFFKITDLFNKRRIIKLFLFFDEPFRDNCF